MVGTNGETLGAILSTINAVRSDVSDAVESVRHDVSELRNDMAAGMNDLRHGLPPRGLCEDHKESLNSLWKAHRDLAKRVWITAGLLSALAVGATLIRVFVL